MDALYEAAKPIHDRYAMIYTGEFGEAVEAERKAREEA